MIILECLNEYQNNTLLHVAMGYSSSEIAQKFCISVQTVKNNIGKIYARMSVNNRIDAVNLFLQSAIILYAKKHTIDDNFTMEALYNFCEVKNECVS